MLLENVALFDMDGSLADYEGQLWKDLMAMQQPGDPEFTSLWKAEREHPLIAQRMFEIKARPGWWRTLPVIESGMRVFRAAHKIGFTNVVLTKGPRRHPLAWSEKVEWCRGELGKKVPVTICENKGIVYGKVLFDDFPSYARDWLEHRPRGLVIMPTNANNKRFKHDQVLKYNGDNFEEVVDALERCYKRKAGRAMPRSRKTSRR
jgi:5'-nucleotidase